MREVLTAKVNLGSGKATVVFVKNGKYFRFTAEIAGGDILLESESDAQDKINDTYGDLVNALIDEALRK